MNLKTLRTIVLVGFASLAGLFSATAAVAASQDECAIWLCLPGGFPAGCGAAHSAMRDRIEDGKSPLPSFGSCAVQIGRGDGSQMSYTFSRAAFVPEHQVCRRWRTGGDESYCTAWETVPEHYVKGARCYYDRDGYRTPAYCTTTYRYVDVFVDGVLAGETYYW